MLREARSGRLCTSSEAYRQMDQAKIVGKTKAHQASEIVDRHFNGSTFMLGQKKQA